MADNPFDPKNNPFDPLAWLVGEGSGVIEDATGVNPSDKIEGTITDIIDPSADDRAAENDAWAGGVNAAAFLQNMLNPYNASGQLKAPGDFFDTSGVMSKDDLTWNDWLHNEELQVTPQMLMEAQGYDATTLSNPYLMENAFNINAPDKTQSAFETMMRDPAGREQLLSSMGYFNNVAQGGDDARAEAEFRGKLADAESAAEAQRLADLQALETRGMSGGGMELLSSLQAGQDMIQSGSRAAADAAGMRQARRDAAAQAGGNLGASYWNQASSDYNTTAQAMDQWSQYWTDLGVDIDKYNADANRDTSKYNMDAQRETDMFNADERNEAKQFNTSEANDASEYNAGVYYDAREANWNRDNDLKDRNVDQANQLATWNNGANQRMFENWLAATGLYTGATRKGGQQYPDYLGAGMQILPMLGGMG